MRYVRKGLDRLFGSQLVDWLQQMTNNRYKAFFAGIVAGAIAPSSSAIAMLSVQMLNQWLLDEIKLMLRTVWMMIWSKNVRLVSKIEEHQRRIEGIQEELKDYLCQISDENLGAPAKRASKSRSPYKALRPMSST